TIILDHAESRVLFNLGDLEGRVGTMDQGVRAWEAAAFSDPLGNGATMTVRFTPDDGPPTLITSVDLRADTGYVTARVVASWDQPQNGAIKVTRLSPLVADADTGGALYVGDDPAKHRMLENGYDLYLDMAAQLHQIGDGGSLLFGPGASSNWNVAIYDPDSRKSLVAGFMSSDRGTGIFGLDYDEAAARVDGSRKGFTRFDAISYCMDQGRAPIPAAGGGAGLASELLYIDFLPETVFDGLESFARRYAARISKKVWTDVPTGWNSWGGGSGSGGLGTNIDEALVMANLDAAVQDFKPFGMKYFMLDDGWQDIEGDWNTNKERFPDHDGMEGMAWLAKKVSEKGMIPGIWISPFEISKKSKLAQEHPDWWADVSMFGAGFVPSDVYIPDLSRPDVLDWVESLFRKVTQEWGFKWVKMDFSYFALFATNLDNPDMTPSEAFHDALARIREAIGPETFFLMISATGISFDQADGNRITLDNEPWWGDDTTIFEQGFKSTYATVIRRYYLNHNLWINHPDLLFWRDNYGLTMEEARAWTTAVGLTGGIVKLGETYTDMHDHPDWREQVYQILPVYPHSARPLDLFDREYPEVLDLKAEREGRKWHVLGLFNWGRNRAIGGTWEESGKRTLTVDLADLGLDASKRVLSFNAWDRDWTWIEDGKVKETLDPHTTRVLILRENPDEPAVVFTTRHLLGGAVEVHDEAYDAGLHTLVASVDTVPGTPITVFAFDAGLTLDDVDLGTGEPPQGADHAQDDGIAWLTFTPTEAETTVGFKFLEPVE
ncbi:MAG: alpha-galactosidase, partial [Deltaproteobacteria bacterium]|nr:alpha-galactosidase [Deltaproteobacteria bacterium]